MQIKSENNEQTDEDTQTLYVSSLSSLGSGGIITCGTIDFSECSGTWSIDAEGNVAN